MVSRSRSRRTLRNALLGRDVAMAFAIIVGLYLLKFTGIQPLQIPSYLLIVAYDFLEGVLPFLTSFYQIGFPLFMYVLAAVGAAVTRRLRAGESDRSASLQIFGGVCLIIGTLSLTFGAFVGGPVLAPGDNPTPLAITGATGLVLLLAGWWLLGRGPLPSRHTTEAR